MTMADPAEEPAGREEARKMFSRIVSGGIVPPRSGWSVSMILFLSTIFFFTKSVESAIFKNTELKN